MSVRSNRPMGSPRKAIYVPGVGQYDNIGDLILRRQLLDWLRPNGRLFIYVGRSPSGYDDGLGLNGEDKVFRSFARWYLSALFDALKGNSAYVFKPGEIQLTLKGMKEHVGMLPVVIATRLRRGPVIRVGAGTRNFSSFARLLMSPSLRLATFTRWRDRSTARYLGTGDVMPDLAFGEGSLEFADEGASRQRDTLVVSMRSDREYPSDVWLESVRIFAQENQLKIVAITQVLRDDEKSASLAQALGGTVVGWDGTEHSLQEERLREIYRHTAIVVSDRLHVLISAFTEGAVPAALQVDESTKIARHFEAAEISDVTFDIRNSTVSGSVDFLQRTLARRTDLFARLLKARANLVTVNEAMSDELLGDGARRIHDGELK